MQLTPLVVEFDNTGNHGTLSKILVMRGAERCVTVPRGFRTDFASIPRILRSLIPQLGEYTAPAVAHDYAYWCGPSMWFTQKQADDFFLELMVDAGVGFFRRWAIYLGLRMGGWVAWKNHRDELHTYKNANGEE